MKQALVFIFVLGTFSGFFAFEAVASEPQKACSTEKINHEDCVVLIDRRYPISMPTFQMSPGKQILVKVQDPLPFETITLDWVSAAALPGTNQGAALVTAVLPNLKGLTLSTQVTPPLAPLINQQGTDPMLTTVQDDIAHLQAALANAQAPIETFFGHATIIYTQLNQITSPLPRPHLGASGAPPPVVLSGTPAPWDHYSDWRTWMLCELIGGSQCSASAAPPFNSALLELAKLQGRLPSTPPANPPTDPLLNEDLFKSSVKDTLRDINQLWPQNQAPYVDLLNQILQQKDRLIAVIASLGTVLPNVQKDFQTYSENINLATGTLPPVAPGGASQPLPNPLELGSIYDPKDHASKGSPLASASFLGRQVVFSVNAINQIATSLVSVAPNSSKTSITTITVLYADARFETSAGAIFSSLPNRSLTNQTVVTPPTGSTLTAGDLYISQTVTHPEVIPFVAANWRLGDDFTWWKSHRRGAAYATGWFGLNPYNVLPEFGGGPSISWRAFMFSFLYHRGHDIRLTQGETVGQVWCNTGSTAGEKPPPCSPAPPSPSTQTHWANAYGFGIGIRVPTTFAAGTGGISQ